MKKNLPQLKDLYSENLEVLQDQNNLNILLSADPKDDWVKKHPFAKNVKYIPIERIEWLLTNIYVKWKVEILREGLLANSVYCSIRLHYRDPITAEWEWQDGIGSAPLQTDTGASATDWSKIKNDAVMKALPSAESYAVKDAAEKLGKMFGKDLNRADKIMYDSLATKFTGTLDSRTKDLIELIDKLKVDDKETFREILQSKRKSKELTFELVEDMIKQVEGLL